MLTRRQKIILRYLLETDNYIDSDEFAVRLNVSTKTVQNEMKAIETYLDKTAVKLLSKRGFGFALSYKNSQDKEVFFKVVHDISPLEDTPTQKAFIICFLLLYEDYVTQEILAMHLYSNKRIIVDLMQQIKEMVRYHQLELIIKPGKGYQFEGDEYAKRLTFIHYYEMICTHQTLVQLFNTFFHFHCMEANHRYILEIRKILRQHNVEISEVNFKRLNIYLSFVLLRIAKKHVLDEKTLKIREFDALKIPAQLIILILLNEDQQLETILLALVLAFLYEKNHLDRLYNHHFMSSYASIADIVSNFMEQYFEPYNYLIASPIELNKSLSLLLIMMTYQKKVGYLERKLELGTIDDEMVIAIECAMLFAENIEENIKLKFNQQDIYTLAYHFNLGFSVAPTIDRKSIAIISEMGEVRAAALARRLRQELAQYTYAINIENYDGNTPFLRQNQLVLTDVEHFESLDESVMVFPSLVEYDMIIPSVRYRLLDKNERNQELLKYFDESRFYPNVLLKTFEDGLNYLAEKCGFSFGLKQQFKRRIMDSHNRFNTVLVNQIAVLRYYDSERTQAETHVLIPHKALALDSHKVKLIFLFIMPNRFPALNLLASPFSRIIMNSNLINSLIRKRDLKAFKEEILETNA